ncbi:hypothetical protein [Deinococcus sp. NW-56]|uniref:hypothetical protein n=1 Tax=Deinococcus sp. NW-56 TaxID=2080419 RepID=UPI000CF442FA|nr:hypothetical protein [Deinococcus sp. NW-56]
MCGLRGAAVLLAASLGLAAALQAQTRLEPQALTGLAVDDLSHLSACPDGTLFGMGHLSQPWQVRLGASQSRHPLKGYVVIRQPGSQTFGLFAGMEGEPLALDCAAPDGEPSLFAASRDSAGVWLARVQARTRGVVWQRPVLPAGSDVDDLTVTPAGEVYLVGHRGPEGPAVLVRVAAQTGVPVTTTELPITGQLQELQVALGERSVWVAGRVGVPNRPSDVFLTRLDPAVPGPGLTVTLGSPAEDVVGDLALTGRRVCLAGSTHGTLTAGDGAGTGNAPQGEADAFVACWTTEGQLLWVRQWGTPQADAYTRLLLREDGGVVAAGYTDGAALPVRPPGAGGGKDALLARYSPQGTLLEAYRYGRSGDETFMALVPASPEGLVLAGRSGPGAWTVAVDAALQVTSALPFGRLGDPSVSTPRP